MYTLVPELRCLLILALFLSSASLTLFRAQKRACLCGSACKYRMVRLCAGELDCCCREYVTQSPRGTLPARRISKKSETSVISQTCLRYENLHERIHIYPGLALKTTYTPHLHIYTPSPPLFLDSSPLIGLPRMFGEINLSFEYTSVIFRIKIRLDFWL